MAAPEWCLRALRTLRPQRPRHKYPDRASSISAAYGAPAMQQCANAHTGIPNDRAGTPARHGRHGRSVRALAVRAVSRLADHCHPLPQRPAAGLCRAGGARATRATQGPAFRAAGRIVLRPHRRRSAARLARADPVRDLPAQSPAGTGLRPIPDRPAPGLAAARRPARPHAAGTARRSRPAGPAAGRGVAGRGSGHARAAAGRDGGGCRPLHERRHAAGAVPARARRSRGAAPGGDHVMALLPQARRVEIAAPHCLLQTAPQAARAIMDLIGPTAP